MIDPNARHFVFDVESIGLHGVDFAVGYVIFDKGEEVEAGWWSRGLADDRSLGTMEDIAWCYDNIPDEVRHPSDPAFHRIRFWDIYMRERGVPIFRNVARPGVIEDGPHATSKTYFWADCAWPVEARFFAAMIDDARRWPTDQPDEGDGVLRPSPRNWQGPYPLHEIATLRALVGSLLPDPVYLPDELPIHHPMMDARRSARQLMAYLQRLQALGI